jgi:hypothetical protein
MDPGLEGVHEEDRPIVRNVIASLEAIRKAKLFTSWSCSVGKGHYIVTAYLTDTDWELGSRELETIHDVNPLRVVSVCVQSQAKRPSVRVKISDRNEPLMLTETQLVHVRKRSRWLMN